jgi:hypothetical protein
MPDRSVQALQPDVDHYDLQYLPPCDAITALRYDADIYGQIIPSLNLLDEWFKVFGSKVEWVFGNKDDLGHCYFLWVAASCGNLLPLMQLSVTQ